jgi:hypothetical protein
MAEHIKATCVGSPKSKFPLIDQDISQAGNPTLKAIGIAIVTPSAIIGGED